MGIVTNTTYKCDCCGRESHLKDFNDGAECGWSNITIKGNEGGLCYGGEWGGTNHNIEKFVCFDCSKKIRACITSIIDQIQLTNDEVNNGR